MKRKFRTTVNDFVRVAAHMKESLGIQLTDRTYSKDKDLVLEIIEEEEVLIDSNLNQFPGNLGFQKSYSMEIGLHDLLPFEKLIREDFGIAYPVEEEVSLFYCTAS